MGLLCLDETLNPGLPAGGYCSKTRTSDADRGWDSFCSPMTPGGGPRLCFQACATDETACTGYPARICSQFVFGLDLGQPACLWGNPVAEDGSPCDDAGDCNAGQGCLSNPFDVPGGLCLTFGCTVGDNTTCVGPDSICVDTGGGGGPGTICLDTCTTSTDCRDAEGYACIMPPGVPVSFCFYPAGDAGDSCAASTECGPVQPVGVPHGRHVPRRLLLGSAWHVQHRGSVDLPDGQPVLRRWHAGRRHR